MPANEVRLMKVYNSGRSFAGKPAPTVSGFYLDSINALIVGASPAGDWPKSFTDLYFTPVGAGLPAKEVRLMKVYNSCRSFAGEPAPTGTRC